MYKRAYASRINVMQEIRSCIAVTDLGVAQPVFNFYFCFSYYVLALLTEFNLTSYTINRSFVNPS